MSEEDKTTVIAGRTVQMGLSVRFCKEKGLKPSVIKAELNNPIFDDWAFLLRMSNAGIIEGEEFTEESGALWVIMAAMVILVGDQDQNDHFLAQRSDNSTEKQPSS